MTQARFPGGVTVEYTATPGVSYAVTVAVGGAAIGATTVPVTATTRAMPAGTILVFSGNKTVRLTAAAALAATSLTVAPLIAALVAGDVAQFEDYVKITEVTSSGYPEATDDRSDVTNFDSLNFQQEHIVGFTNNGDLTVEANWTGSAEQEALFAHFDNRDTLGWRIRVPNLNATDTSGFQTVFTGQLARCTHNALTPRDPVKLLLTVVVNAPSRAAAPAYT